jgi:gliding motility-associated-like protein
MTSIPFLIDASGDNFVYYWNDGSANPVYAAYDPGLLNVEICNAGCCIPDSVILFKQEVDIWIPSAFSPNADGVNDVFVPKVAPGITGQMYIYNRQGQLLHKCTQLDEGWDGRNKGKQCKNDVYIWMIEHDKTQCRKYGTVMLLN